LRLLPGGAARGPADRFFWPGIAAPPPHTNHKTKKKNTPPIIKKKLKGSPGSFKKKTPHPTN
ncbi:hypothetical protein, partial [Enterobacter intestinihominis]